MKTKHALFILIAGICLDFPGAMMKIMHYPYAHEVLFAAMVIKIVGFVLLTYKVVKNPKVREFFNS
ncbi:GldL-related protein [Flavobacterium silvaticum]|uniref:Gliding motility protein GldL-like N-terminal domain-containing protein n=1 Tax=Flavobacterium silvaticum TaxID=1852020 RepID=A0A972JGP9_9FLAO|nr:hypothetical protein [Flavobacterium silvaticum]NMH27105.1 hypothetical protein [Flavobacterium silvaticum]